MDQKYCRHVFFIWIESRVYCKGYNRDYMLLKWEEQFAEVGLSLSCIASLKFANGWNIFMSWQNISSSSNLFYVNLLIVTTILIITFRRRAKYNIVFKSLNTYSSELTKIRPYPKSAFIICLLTKCSFYFFVSALTP